MFAEMARSALNAGYVFGKNCSYVLPVEEFKILENSPPAIEITESTLYSLQTKNFTEKRKAMKDEKNGNLFETEEHIRQIFASQNQSTGETLKNLLKVKRGMIDTMVGVLVLMHSYETVTEAHFSNYQNGINEVKTELEKLLEVNADNPNCQQQIQDTLDKIFDESKRCRRVSFRKPTLKKIKDCSFVSGFVEAVTKLENCVTSSECQTEGDHKDQLIRHLMTSQMLDNYNPDAFLICHSIVLHFAQSKRDSGIDACLYN